VETRVVASAIPVPPVTAIPLMATPMVEAPQAPAVERTVVEPEEGPSKREASRSAATPAAPMESPTKPETKPQPPKDSSAASNPPIATEQPTAKAAAAPAPPAMKVEAKPRPAPVRDRASESAKYRLFGVVGALAVLSLVYGIVYVARKKPSTPGSKPVAQVVQAPKPAPVQTNNGSNIANAPPRFGTGSSSSSKPNTKATSPVLPTLQTSPSTQSDANLSFADELHKYLASQAKKEGNGSTSQPGTAKPTVQASQPHAGGGVRIGATEPYMNKSSLLLLDMMGGTWTDPISGLIWAEEDFSQLAIHPSTASRPLTRIAYAQVALRETYNKFSYGGFSDWRIPTKGELATICGSSLARVNYGINFKQSASFLYWTSTTDPLAVVMNCKTGKTGGVSVDEDLGHLSEPTTIPTIRPVRGHLR
jgi:Protein of unknown function (DUF1566)